MTTTPMQHIQKEIQNVTSLPASGIHHPNVKKQRSQLFEEFVQCGEDWATSSLAISSTQTDGVQVRGIYKLMSVEDIWL